MDLQQVLQSIIQNDSILDVKPWKSKKIRVVGSRLSNGEVDQLLKTLLSTYHSVKNVEISLCEISEESLLSFSKSMKDFSLLILRLVRVGVTDKVAIALATAIQECALKKMDLTHNLIGHIGAKALADSLKDCGLEMLFLGRNSIGEQGALAFAEALSSGNTSLKSLDIHMNEIGDDAGQAFFSVLPKTGLQTLRIDSNNLGEKSIIQMCNTLPSSDLEVLYIGGNQLEVSLIEKIAQVLNKSKIRKLCLNDTSLNNNGAFALAKAIKSNNIVETIDIRDNPEIDDEGLESIFDAVKSHPSIQHVVTSGTNATSKLQNAIEVYVSSLRSKRASIITSLLSVKFVPSIGTRSSLQKLPLDLFRTLAEML